MFPSLQKNFVLVASLEKKLLLDLLLWLALIHIRILVGAKLKSITIMLEEGY